MHNTQPKTSETHPLRIDWVKPCNSWGSIGMSFCPGKTQKGALSGDWQRDLAADMQVIRASGVKTVVSLIELHEFSELKVTAIPTAASEAGLKWVHLPITDMCAPSWEWLKLWSVLGGELVDQLSRGESIFVHCKGGLGRAGTVAACLLIESGMAPANAIRAVRAARPGTIEVNEQEDFVMCYKALHGRNA